MSIWRNLKARLGLGDEYDDYDDYEDAGDSEDGYEARDTPRSPYADEPTTIRRVVREPDMERARDGSRYSSRSGSSSYGSGSSHGAGGGSFGSAAPSQVPSMQAVPQVKIQIIEPRAYADAQAMADKFKVGVPVIMNLTMTDADLAKRLIDFASGLTYGLNGGLQKVSEKVFMLTPANVNVTDAQRAALRDKGLFSDDR